jgi:4-alpha-glucanotransferase
MLATGRISGVLLPVFSLRSKADFGIGDFGALHGLLDWMEVAQQRLLMMLPLLPTAPGDSSPYSTRSAFGLNPLFIDLERVPEHVELGGAQTLSALERQRLEEARAAERIRYDWVFGLKEAALRRAFERFEQTHAATRSARAKELERYQEEQREWLEAFCLFCAVSREQRLLPWWEWPEPLRARQPAALAEAAARLSSEVRFQSWLQWCAESQWNEVRAAARRRGILLCGDEPFIISKDSADVWVRPGQLRCDARLGAPPDDFSATGQDWGLPYFDFAAMEGDGFRWLRARARKAASYYDLRRVDHAVGYFRQWIRDAQSPIGRFVPPDEGAHRALGERNFRMLSEGAGIVAEDLGVIPDWVRETLTALGLPGYRVLRWERDGNAYRNPHHFPALSLVCTGTHDTEPLKEWWQSRPDDERQAVARAYPELAGVEPKRELTRPLHEALLAAAASAGSDLCVLPWQDVIGTTERINLPGSMSDANWSYRIAHRVDQLLVEQAPRQAGEQLARLTRAGRRVPA